MKKYDYVMDVEEGVRKRGRYYENVFGVQIFLVYVFQIQGIGYLLKRNVLKYCCAQVVFLVFIYFFIKVRIVLKKIRVVEFFFIDC